MCKDDELDGGMRAGDAFEREQGSPYIDSPLANSSTVSPVSLIGAV